LSRIIEVNKPVIEEFSAFEWDGTTKRTGLTMSAFNTLILYNKTVQTISYNIGEYETTGTYWVEFTPDKLGFWEFEVKVNFSGQLWYETFDVVNKRELSDVYNQVLGSVVLDEQNNKLICIAWLQRNGEMFETPTQCKWSFYDSENNLLFQITQNIPFSTGYFRGEKVPVFLASEKTYYYICEIYDGVRWVKSGLSFVILL
jgi:hypothetical protein